MTGGEVNIASSTFSLASANFGVFQTGGVLNISSSTIDTASLASGIFASVSGSSSNFGLINSVTDTGTQDVALVDAANLATVRITGNRIKRGSNIAYGQATIVFPSPAGQGVIADNVASTVGTGSGALVSVGQNQLIIIHDNSLFGWTIGTGGFGNVFSHDNH
jgi:hypothetical protein